MTHDHCVICGCNYDFDLVQVDLIGPWHKGQRDVTLCISCKGQVFPERPIRITSPEYASGIRELLNTEMSRYPEGYVPRLVDIAKILNDAGWRTVRGHEYTTSSTYLLLEKLGINRAKTTLHDEACVPLPLAEPVGLPD